VSPSEGEKNNASAARSLLSDIPFGCSIAWKKMIDVPPYIQGLIFDCDGTLVDSMPLHMRAWEHAIARAGTIWDYEFFFSKKGMEEEEIVDLYNERFGTSLDSVATVRSKHEYFRAHPSDFKPIEQVVAVVWRYKDILPMAVASGSTRDNVHLELEAVGIKHLFTVILTADDEIRPKPSGDIFLEAARWMNVPPHRCLVFEDGDLGLEAARGAGMDVVDVRRMV
jgi:beta-phosphoglucomutase-like phosphatase (HAD superfamily)